MPYEADPAFTDVPMHLEEIEALAAEGARDFRDARKGAHFLGRVIATVRQKSEQVRQLNRDIHELRRAAEQVGRPTTLHPSDAVKYLSDAEREQLFGTMQQEQLAALRREQEKAAGATRAAMQTLGRVRYGLVSLLEDPATPAAVKARLQQMLASIEAPGAGSPSQAGSAPVGSMPAGSAPRPPSAPPAGDGWPVTPGPSGAFGEPPR